MSFTVKTLRVTIVMAQGVFSDDNNAITIEGLPIVANVSKPGGADLGKMLIDIWGLKLDTMKKLTSLAFRKLQSLNNKIKLEAGDKGQELHLVFSGEITTAVPVFDTNGEARLQIEAAAGAFPNKIAAPPISVKGDTTIEKLMSGFAKEAGYTLKNEGVTGSVKNSIYKGSPILKARTLARQAGIELLIDDDKFVILPKGGAITGHIPLLNKDSGLLGYPSFTNDGVDCKTIYDHRLDLGGLVEIESVVPRATGIWKITKLDHMLCAYKAIEGDWLTAFSAVWRDESNAG